MDDEAFKRKLASSYDITAELGPLDGCVAALLPDGLFVTTPNQPIIPQPPIGERTVFRRVDGRFGDDDNTQWPQPYLFEAPHFACIPRRINEAPYDIIWYTPEQTHFTPSRHNPSIGRLDTSHRETLRAVVFELRDRAHAYTKRDPKLDLIRSLRQSLSYGISRVENVPTCFGVMVWAVRAVQRCWLELRGALDYMEIFKPRMDGVLEPYDAHAIPAQTIGAFIYIHEVARSFFTAGLPYWFIEDRNRLADQNVRMTVAVTSPHSCIAMDQWIPTSPTIWTGPASSFLKVRAIHRDEGKYLSYPNPFNTSPVMSTSTSNPSTAESTPSSSAVYLPQAGGSRFQPRSASSPQLQRTRSDPNSNKPYSRSTALKDDFTINHDAFKPVKHEMLPKAIPAWERACTNVKAEKSLLVHASLRHRDDARTMFPDPKLFINISSDRLARFLTIWEAVREACVYRAVSSTSQASPLSNQEWRDLLSSARNPRTETIARLFSDSLAEFRVDFDSLRGILAKPLPGNNIIQRTMWELYEYNFRYGHETRLQNALNPDTDDPLGLFTFDYTYASTGLAHPIVQTRALVLFSLRLLIQDWAGADDRAIILEDDGRDFSGAYLKELEDTLAAYYCQMFFNNFGRAPSIPHFLPVDS
ncbi:hypothetical protein BDN72DRAFT_905856 [Pluteus cervinus]|uniref:Uncharacterized protein n=1 Tax=Pluteus cervinus TaxID=181527 RepID=A0ACD3A1B4_9AGAR|nr:hypothetical protein BDN72DRAFT_905856 [Pluteus cervinus]